ncbi:hypothetical protein ARMGADRAFT_1077645 [Armillaria gallica]|uniref:Uncharacterized protein n=1 Tax=Armillaria gallica TaxID=47427 RepID=A0A2H3DLQ3_ARMGA|nr:hypothetical protein ARMGADRAFT_1077645 [Armillaria gallica]
MEAPPPDLSQHDKSVILDSLDLTLNITILHASLHGICLSPVPEVSLFNIYFEGLYTGIIAITLWITFTSTKRSQHAFLRAMIIMLYVLRTMSFMMICVHQSHAFIEHGNNSYSVFTALIEGSWSRACGLVDEITGGISTLLVDIAIIWRCWVLWDRQWRIVSLPIICAAAGIVMKTLQILSTFPMGEISNTGGFVQNINWELIYVVSILITTLVCTILIVYRIVRFAHRLLFFRSSISALIESSSIYTLALILYLVLEGRNMMAAQYGDTFATYIQVKRCHRTDAPGDTCGRQVNVQGGDDCFKKFIGHSY